jgi:redox-sensitive bicupin YhaK (pirin superfamily)
MPSSTRGGVALRVLAGSAYGLTAPVATLSPLFYVDATMPAGSELALPEEYEERAVYVVDGEIACGGEHAKIGRMLVLGRGLGVAVRAAQASRVVLVGGAPLDGERYIDWNFVSSSKERIARAAHDWREGRFPKVPGDEVEFIPLPEISSSRSSSK